MLGNILKYKVAQIIPYFGKWPEWIELYMYSCGKNPMVDFIFYTDCPLPKRRYANTIFHICSFEDYKSLVGQRLGIDYTIKSAYKLTDLKPFLGVVHEPELKDYDFWGFGDLDLVYGDLSMVVNEKNLTKYDLITTHNYHIAGHFTLCRNNEHYRNLCFKLKNWKTGLVEDVHHGYDEGEWSNLVYPQLALIHTLYRRVLKRFGLKLFPVLDALNPIFGGHRMFVEYFTSPNPAPENDAVPEWRYEPEIGVMKNLNRGGHGIPYLHFLFFKKTPWLETDFYWRDGFYQLEGDFEKYETIIFDYQKITGCL